MQAAEGDADVAFWRRIYNPIDAYGGLVITDGSRACIRISSARPPSPRQIQMLDLPIDEPRDRTSADRWYSGPGVSSGAVPSTMARVTVNVVDGGDQELCKVALVAGVVGVAHLGRSRAGVSHGAEAVHLFTWALCGETGRDRLPAS